MLLCALSVQKVRMTATLDTNVKLRCLINRKSGGIMGIEYREADCKTAKTNRKGRISYDAQ